MKHFSLHSHSHHIISTLLLTTCIVHQVELMLIAKEEIPTTTIQSTLSSIPIEDKLEAGNFSSKLKSKSTPISTSTLKANNKGKPPPYKTVSPEDDELHDDEIIEAVRNSLRLWKEGKLNKTHRNRVKRDEEVVCYGSDLGCFRDEGAFDYLDMLPSTPEEIGTKFLFYIKENEPEIYSFFNYTKVNLQTSKFNSSIPTKIIIHGFGSTCLRMWANEMRNALLSVGDCNVICVDWENGSALPNYVRAAVNTRLVGKQLSLLIRWLVAPGTSSYEDFHLIGFSLGAQVAGFAGQELRNISRITGLDPAGPLFENYDKRVRLDQTDALFVDVIHSNGDSLLMGGLGSWEPIGHLDFYPNGGRVQKGCSNLFLGAFRDFIWSSPSNKDTVQGSSDSRNGKSLQSSSDNDGRSLCNHRRAYKFFTESVSPRCPYPSFSCDSYDKFLTGACFQWDNNLLHSAHMGYYADEHQSKRSAKQLAMNPTAPGNGPTGPGKGNGRNFYLMTRDDEPFCANQYKIILESSPPLGIPISTYGGVEVIIINNNKEEFNETFLVTQTHKDNMISGSVLQKLIVAHPAINEPAKLVLKYTAYKGWIYSGISRWSLDRIVVTNAFGTSYSFCTRGLLLPSGISVTITLNKGVCSVATSFPYRHSYLHPNIHHHPQHYNSHHIHHLMGPSPMLRNELNINDTLSLPPPPAQPQHPQYMGTGSPTGTSHLQIGPNQETISPYPPTAISNNNGNLNNYPDNAPSVPSTYLINNATSTSVPEFIDWSNDWHPIIHNKNYSNENQMQVQDKLKEKENELGPSSCKQNDTNCATNMNNSVSPDASMAPISQKNIIDVDHQIGNLNEIDHNSLSNEKRYGRQLGSLLLIPLSRGIEPRPVILRTSAPSENTREARKLHSLTSSGTGSTSTFNPAQGFSPASTNSALQIQNRSQFIVYT